MEVGSVKDSVVYGNVYELDYKAHVAEVRRNAVEAGMVHKVFEDGFVDQVSPEQSSYGYYVGLVEKHGTIVDSLWAPKDEAELSYVLRAQKQARRALHCFHCAKGVLIDAEERSNSADTGGVKEAHELIL